MIAIHDKRYSEYQRHIQRHIQRLIDKGEIGIETYQKPIAKSGKQSRRERRKQNKK